MLASAAVWAAQPLQPNDGVVRLIVQGDDLGVGHGVNEATLQAYREGILRTANVIVPGPWLLEAAQIFGTTRGSMPACTWRSRASGRRSSGGRSRARHRSSTKTATSFPWCGRIPTSLPIPV